MRKLSKAQLVEKESLAVRLDDAHQILEDELNIFNVFVATAWKQVSKAVEDYNEAVQAANDFTSGIASDIESYTSDKSHRWQRSDAASSYGEWLAEYEEELPEADFNEPEEISMDDDLANGDALREKSDEVSS